MAADIPYMMTVKNVPEIFDKMRSAGTPPKFNRTFLSETLGFKASGDRGIIKILKQLRLLSNDGVPQQEYNEFRQAGSSGIVIAQGLRDGWHPVFLADQNAHSLSASELTEIMKNVSGKGEAVAKKMASTFRALADQGDWSGEAPVQSTFTQNPDGEDQVLEPPSVEAGPSQGDLPRAGEGGTLTLHSDVHVHLPLTSDVAVYTAIFRAIREELVD